MNIAINENWKIESDPLNVTLYERKVNNTPKSKNFGQERWQESGYYGSLEQAYNGYLRRNSLRSEAKDFAELVSQIKELEAYIKQSIGSISRSDMTELDKIKADRLKKKKEKSK